MRAVAGASSQRLGGVSQCSIPSSRSRTPTPVRADPQKSGEIVPSAICSRKRSRRKPSSISPPVRSNSSMTRSSRSAKQIDQRSAPVGGGPVDRFDRRVRFTCPNRTVQRNHRELEPAADIDQHRVWPGAHAVDLVDEEEEGAFRRANGAGELDGLRLHAFHGRDDQHDRIEHPQRALDFGHEVGMPGSIDEVDFEVVQAETRRPRT